jgi:hypothetical protein
MISLIMNLPHVQAFNKNGPNPIPGNLFPHPNTSDNNHTKHAGGTLHLHTVITTDLKKHRH